MYEDHRPAEGRGDRLEEACALARAGLQPRSSKTAGVTQYVLAWDGYVTTEHGRWDTVLVESARADDPVAVRVAQRYEPVDATGADDSKVAAVGKPVLTQRMTSPL